MSHFAIYHGSQPPPSVWASAFSGDIVLQPFHPLVVEGGYEDWFPLATRWVYSNPTAVDPERQSGVPASVVAHDPSDRWRIPRLQWPQARPFALDDAATLVSLPGVHGLFVDDLDRLVHSATADAATAFLGHLGVPLFVNRGFAILADAPTPWEALLVESLDPALAEPAAHDWVHDAVLSRLSRASAQGVRIYRLEYGPSPQRDETAAVLNDAVSSYCLEERRISGEMLDDWRDWTPCPTR